MRAPSFQTEDSLFLLKSTKTNLEVKFFDFILFIKILQVHSDGIHKCFRLGSRPESRNVQNKSARMRENAAKSIWRDADGARTLLNVTAEVVSRNAAVSQFCHANEVLLLLMLAGDFVAAI